MENPLNDALHHLTVNTTQYCTFTDAFVPQKASLIQNISFVAVGTISRLRRLI